MQLPRPSTLEEGVRELRAAESQKGLRVLFCDTFSGKALLLLREPSLRMLFLSWGKKKNPNHELGHVVSGG